jgi:ankyrin repeat protein
VRTLLDRGARINKALLSAVQDYDMVKFLLSRGAKVIASPMETSAIDDAAGAGSTEVVRMLLSHADEVDIKSSRAALNFAASGGRSDNLHVLIDHGFDVNAFIKGCFVGESPLLAVCQAREQNQRVLKTLLDKGADTSIQASNGDTPRRSQFPIPSQLIFLLTSLKSPRNGLMERPLNRPTTPDRRRRHIPP